MFKLYAVLLGIILCYLIAEYTILNHFIRRIPIRILINGTRGKSTTVRIIHAIFLASGWRTFAKTTGDRICLYNPDGTFQIRKRYAPANIIENVGILRRWARRRPRAVVLECMAIQSEFQYILSRIYQPTHIVITNILPDHFEQMGQELDQIRHTILQCVIPGAHVFIPENESKYLTGDTDFKSRLKQVISRPCEYNFENIPREIIHNSWGLIVSLCNSFDIPVKEAGVVFRNIWESENKNIFISSAANKYSFINLFSVNDPHSARIFILHFINLAKESLKRVVVLNTRRDRPMRTLQFLRLIDDVLPDSTIWLTGTGKSLGARLARRLNIRLAIDVKSMNDLHSDLSRGFPQPVILFGLGNHLGTDSLLDMIIGTISS